MDGVGEIGNLLGGIPQEDWSWAIPAPRSKLIEYGDLQCPVCKAYSEDFLPPIIEDKVKKGEARLVFRNFAFIGPQSAPAGAAALAAGAQERGWQYLELFYRNQGVENSGYADDEFLTAVAKSAGVEDISRWNRERKSAKITAEVVATTEEAQDLGLTGTPSFAIRGPSTDGLEPIGTPSSPGEVEAAIDSAS